jgi:hypothetical protein
MHRVKITPTQFHFHTRGEHVIDGGLQVLNQALDARTGCVPRQLPAEAARSK